jgi:hypothetical protein
VVESCFALLFSFEIEEGVEAATDPTTAIQGGSIVIHKAK